MHDSKQAPLSADFEMELSLGIEMAKQGFIRRPNWPAIYMLVGSAYFLLFLSTVVPVLRVCVMFPTIAAAALFYIEPLKRRS